MVTVGSLDWAAEQGTLGENGKSETTGKVDAVLNTASRAEKITAVGVSGIEQARNYRALGVRVLFVGVDVALKRDLFMETLGKFQKAMATSVRIPG